MVLMQAAIISVPIRGNRSKGRLLLFLTAVCRGQGEYRMRFELVSGICSARLVANFNNKKIAGLEMSSPFQFSKKSHIRSPEFTLGVSTAAQQIEGGRHALGRKDSIWDVFCDQPGNIANGDSADHACEHIKYWRGDVQRIADLGVDAYRFSISWPRVIQNCKGDINEEGLGFYDQLVDELLQNNIQPFVTLYHWDLPRFLHDQPRESEQGWLNRDTAEHFSHYARVIAERLGDRIASIATFNEPWCSAVLGYGKGLFAPGFTNRDYAFLAAHQQLRAHGQAIEVIRQTRPNLPAGIVINAAWAEAASPSKQDRQALEVFKDSMYRLFLGPLLNGQYPESLQTEYAHLIDDKFESDLKGICQPLDFIGLNYYARENIKAAPECEDGFESVPPDSETPTTAMGWEIYPQGLTNLLQELSETYSMPPIYITENGMAGDDYLKDGEVNDGHRVEYLNSHLHAVETAIQKGVDVRGYFVWSLMDNFEWAEGYDKRFGIIYIDYETQERVLKKSAKLLSDFLHSRF